MILYKYSCGCIGFPPDDKGVAYILKPCDVDAYSYEYALVKKSMNTNDSLHRINQEELENIAADVKSLLADGYALREIRYIIVKS